MGTSTKYPGPRGGRWKAANLRLGCWVGSIERSAAREAGGDGHGSGPTEKLIWKVDDKARELADQYRGALAATLSDDPAAFGLRNALRSGGNRLVDTLESLRTGTAGWCSGQEDSVHAREEAFVRGFVEQVAGSGSLVVDAVIRQAAVSCAQELLDAPGPLREAVRDGTTVQGARISGELFCLVFQLFFKDALTRFITAIISGKIRLAFPLLRLIDPAGKIAGWVGQQVAALIPDPCETGARLADKPSLADLASGLVDESVDRALGIPVAAGESAAA
jgi:hypothetical protein